MLLNIFSDDMEGQYKFKMSYRYSKVTCDWVAIGFAIATGAAFVIACFGALLWASEDVYLKISPPDSSSKPSETKMDEVKKEEQTATPGDTTTPGESETHSGLVEEPKPTEDNPDPAPDYYGQAMVSV